MSTYTDLHTRVIKENISILRKPSQKDDGLTMQRVVFANKDNVYFGTFKGPLELSDSTMTNTTINGGKLNGTDITEGIVKYDNGDIKASEIANNQLADEAQLSALQEDMQSISAAHDALSTSLSTAISALDIRVNERIDEVSADLGHVSADLYVLSTEANAISGTVSSISAEFIDIINTAKDDAIASARVYTDESIETLSSTVDGRLVELSNVLSSYSDTLCSEISNAIDANYVHKAGDKIAHLSVDGTLNVSGRVYVASSFFVVDDDTAMAITDDEISIKSTNAPIEIATAADLCLSSAQDIRAYGDDFVGIFNDNISLSAKDGLASINVNGTSIQSTFDGLSNTVDFKYENQCLYLSANGKSCEVNCSAFIKDGMLDEVRYDADGDETHVNPPYLVLTFNTDAGKDDIWVSVKDLVNTYEASNDGIELSGNKFCLKYADIKDKTGLDLLCADLFGTTGAQPKQGIIPEIKEQISAISVDNFQVMSFAGHFIDNNPYYDSISTFFATQHGSDYEPRNVVKNDSAFNIVTEDISTIIVNGDNVLSFGNGDVLVVHDHSNARYVDVSCLSYSNNISGNVYLLKAGVSRYEFEDERAQRAADDSAMSAWIMQNFANTSADSSALTTTLKQDVSASQSLSVAYNAYVLSDLSVAKSLFVNNAQLAITVEQVDPNDPASETQTVARTIADEIEFMTSSEEDAPSISITKNAISFSSAPIYVSTSSFIISDDQAKVIDAASSHVEILSTLKVEADKATATALSVGVLSADFSRVVDFNSMSSIYDVSTDLNYRMLQNDEVLSTSIDNKIFIDGLSVESLSAQHISQEDYYGLVISSSAISNVLYVVSGDYINAYGEQVKNLAAPTDLSDATTKEYVDSISSSLDFQVQKLSDDLSDEISSLADKVVNALSAIENGPLSNLNTESDLSDVIDATVIIRNMLSALRENFQA